jgi:uncharacterized protein (TIGR02145 family)
VNTISKISFTSGNYQPSLLEVVTVLDSAKAKFIEYANLTNGDLTNSLDLTEYWLMKQPNVQSTFSMDDGYIYITLKSGINTTFYFDAVDNDGHSTYRGGKGGSTIKSGNEFINNAKEILTKNAIENKKVLLFETDVAGLDLEPQIKVITDILNNAGLNLKVTVFRNEECTLEAVESFKDYGLAIIDGHGQISSFNLGKFINLTNKPKTEESVKNEINTQLGPGSADKVSSGTIELAASVKGNPQETDWVKNIKADGNYSEWLTGNYIAKLPTMPKTIIFGNMCFSGWLLSSFTTSQKIITKPDKTLDTIPAYTRTFEYPVGKAFIERNLISYYGYTRNDFYYQSRLMPKGTSRSVTDIFSKDRETVFIKRLAESKDSTGVANLKSDNTTEYFEPEDLQFNRLYGDLYFRHYGANNYFYEKCGDTLIDTRDGQKYATVCIGNQNWMAQNLNYNAPGSITYENNPANGNIYGRLYGFQTMMQGTPPTNANPSGVQGVCPKGWHVPSDEEFSELFGIVSYPEGGNLKSTSPLWNSPNLDATNSTGFSALPGGFSSDISKPDYFINLGYSAIFGTTTITDNVWQGWGILSDSNTLDGFGEDPQKSGVSCRCVKD